MKSLASISEVKNGPKSFKHLEPCVRLINLVETVGVVLGVRASSAHSCAIRH